MNKIEKCRNTQVNRIVIHKGNKEKRIYSAELETYLTDGWSKGFSENHKKINSEKHKGLIPWNKNTKGLMKPNRTTWQKGNIPWNKGNKSPKKKKSTITESIGKEEMLKRKGLKISKSKKGHIVTKETREKISKSKKNKKMSPEKLEIKTTKEYLTKKKNNSFNNSQLEQDFYNNLLKENRLKTIYRQYKDKERYPFYCDFYIKEDDLFIECNFHWTHGGKPYDPNDKECQEKLNLWQEKAKTSKFYQQAIYVWTELDVKKQKTAKDNNINYKVIY